MSRSEQMVEEQKGNATPFVTCITYQSLSVFVLTILMFVFVPIGSVFTRMSM